MWVYGNSGDAVPFDASLIEDRKTLWTPTVDGDTIHLEIEVPRAGGPASFVIRELAQIVPTALPGNLDSSCLVDAACITTAMNPRIDALHHAVAQLRFIEGANAFVCTGGLLTDRAADFTPYLLTANHCFSDQAAASSLEAYWDYIRATCNGSIPSRTSFPKSQGATLLATDSGLAALARASAALDTAVRELVWLPSEEPSEPEPGRHWKKLPARLANPSLRHC